MEELYAAQLILYGRLRLLSIAGGDEKQRIGGGEKARIYTHTCACTTVAECGFAVAVLHATDFVYIILCTRPLAQVLMQVLQVCVDAYICMRMHAGESELYGFLCMGICLVGCFRRGRAQLSCKHPSHQHHVRRMKAYGMKKHDLSITLCG